MLPFLGLLSSARSLNSAPALLRSSHHPGETRRSLDLLGSFIRKHQLGISSYESPAILGGCSASAPGLQKTDKAQASDLRKESQQPGPHLGRIPQVPQLPGFCIPGQLWSITGPGPHPGSATYRLLYLPWISLDL